MSTASGRNSPPKIDLGHSQIRLGRGRAVILVASAVVLIGTIFYSIMRAGTESPVSSAVAGAIMVLAPLVIGVLLSPEQKPKDYSMVAVQAVSELDELRRGNRSLVEELLQVDVIHDGARAQFVIAKNAEEMERQFERLGQGAGHWFEVSPDVGTRFKEKEERNQKMLLDMERVRMGEDHRDG